MLVFFFKIGHTQIVFKIKNKVGPSNLLLNDKNYQKCSLEIGVHRSEHDFAHDCGDGGHDEGATKEPCGGQHVREVWLGLRGNAQVPAAN